MSNKKFNWKQKKCSLNCYEHCANYTTTEELETERTFSLYSENFITPPEMKRSLNLCIGLAFDNFDWLVEISTGKDTLHDTLCIAYQHQTEESTNEVDHEYGNQTSMEQNINKPVKRRCFCVIWLGYRTIS